MNKILLFIMFFWSGIGFASELIPSQCAYIKAESEYAAFSFDLNTNYSYKPLTCRDLKNFRESLEAVAIAMAPMTVIVNSIPVREALMAQAIELGITTANPVVLSILVFGATGYSTLYYIIKKKVEDCQAIDKELMRRQLIEDIRMNLNMNTNPYTTIDLNY